MPPAGKRDAGLDQHQVRLWYSFHRHTVLSMCALALLAVAAARPPAPLAPAQDAIPADATQPAAWADTGQLPLTADERPPEDPGMVKVGVPEPAGSCTLLPRP